MIGWLLADILLLLFKLDLSYKLYLIKLRPLPLYVMLADCLLWLLNMMLLPILPVGGFTRLLSVVLLRLSDTWPLAILLGALRRCTLAPK